MEIDLTKVNKGDKIDFRGWLGTVDSVTEYEGKYEVRIYEYDTTTWHGKDGKSLEYGVDDIIDVIKKDKPK